MVCNRVDQVTSSARSEDDRQIDITLSNRDGTTTILKLTPAAVADLAVILAEYANCDGTSGPVATKLPKDFAVGTARYEKWVLVRFEDEAPYALEPALANRLAQALIVEAANLMIERMAHLRH